MRSDARTLQYPERVGHLERVIRKHRHAIGGQAHLEAHTIAEHLFQPSPGRTRDELVISSVVPDVRLDNSFTEAP